MTTPFQLPSHILAAPTPRTDAVSVVGKFQSGDGKEHVSVAVPEPFSKQLEREAIWRDEVIEKMRDAMNHANCICSSVTVALTAYNNLKAYMEQKK